MSWYERPYARNDYGGGRRFPDNPLAWAPTIGHVFGIRVRVHMLFILFIALELLRAGRAFSYVGQWLLLLFGSVFLHELGHCFAARHVGGRAEEVLMWPLGGLAMVDAPRAPWPQFVTVIWGPLVNLALFSVASLLLWSSMARDAIPLVGLLQGLPLIPRSWADPTAWLWLIKRINIYLFLFNLWPMYPMDGGRLLQCALWARVGLHRAMMFTGAVGMVAAIFMGLFGLASGQLLFVAIAIMGYMMCHQQRQALKAGALQEDSFLGYDFSGGYTTLEGGRRRREGWLARRRRRRAEALRKRQAAARQAEAAEVDRILSKVHEQGLNSLTRGEKRTLQIASQREQQRRPTGRC